MREKRDRLVKWKGVHKNTLKEVAGQMAPKKLWIVGVQKSHETQDELVANENGNK